MADFIICVSGNLFRVYLIAFCAIIFPISQLVGFGIVWAAFALKMQNGREMSMNGKRNRKGITRIILLLIVVVLLIFVCVRWKAGHSVEGEEAFKAVLFGDAQFFYASGGNIEAMAVTDVPSLFDADDPFMKIWELSVVDLDGDGEDEVILFVVGAAGDTGGKVILHQIGGEIYGYITDNRALVDLKPDGTYYFSDPTGSIEAGIAAITDFSETGYTVDKVSCAVGTYEGWDTFIADHQPATEEEYLETVSRQDKKQNAERYDFNNENIEALF